MRFTPEGNPFPIIYFVRNDHWLVFCAVGQENLCFHGIVIRFQVCGSHESPPTPPNPRPCFSFCPWHLRRWALSKKLLLLLFSSVLSVLSAGSCFAISKVSRKPWIPGRFNQELTERRGRQSGSSASSVQAACLFQGAPLECTFHFGGCRGRPPHPQTLLDETYE